MVSGTAILKKELCTIYKDDRKRKLWFCVCCTYT